MSELDGFYRAFEDRWRGSPERVRARLQAYGPFVQALSKSWPRDAGAPQGLDLGCGRGEWVRLLSEWGFEARGVDLDAEMLAAGRALGLQLDQGDGLEQLRAAPSQSLALVSAFHVVEHLPFERMREWVVESLRVLAPGGLLILETPNPENLVVGAFSFYVDPTHQRPVPSELLSFVTEHAGFLRSKVVRLNEPVRIDAGHRIGLLDVFDGVSPDYAVIAQKSGAAQILASVDDAFAGRYGYKLGHLALAYEQQLDAQRRALEARIGALEAQVAQIPILHARAAQLEAFQAEIHHSVAWRLARRANPLAQRLVVAVRSGRLWSGIARRLLALPKRLAARLARTRLRNWIMPVLNRLPRLKQALRGAADAPLPIPPAVDRTVVLSDAGARWAARIQSRMKHGPVLPKREGDAPSH